jgi:hypothetical protein
LQKLHYDSATFHLRENKKKVYLPSYIHSLRCSIDQKYSVMDCTEKERWNVLMFLARNYVERMYNNMPKHCFFSLHTHMKISSDGSMHIVKQNGYLETRVLCEQINKQTPNEMMAVVEKTTGWYEKVNRKC